MVSTSAILLACTGHSTQRPSGTRSLIGASLRWPLEPQPAPRAGLDGVDRKTAVGAPPSGIGPPILVVAAQMPDHVGQLIPVLAPVMRDAGDAPAGTIGLQAGVEDLADDRVLGADGRGHSGDRGADRGMTAMPVDRVQRGRRLRQPQLTCVREKAST